MTSFSYSNHDIPLDTLTTLQMLDHDPVSVYRRLRKDAPIVRIQAIDRIVLTKADDVYLAKTDTEHFGSFDTHSPMHRAFGGHTLMRKDGPAHLREREAMATTFHEHHLCSTWSKIFESVVDQVINQLPETGIVDLLASLAAPISAKCLKNILGINVALDDKLFEWATALINGAMNSCSNVAVFRSSDQANEEMNQCFDQMIVAHRANPNASILSSMVNQPNPIPLSQIRTNMKICIGGAAIEMRDALLTTLHGLLQNPAQLNYCLKTGNWSLACEEALRWVAPIQVSPRIVKKCIELRGITLPAGEAIMVIQGSANHDEDYWLDPQTFDIHRPSIENHTFGAGPHRCLGSGMYRRLICSTILPKLFCQFPKLRPAIDYKVEFRGFAFRGLASLPVQLA
ncbi:cytochrome P450 [Lentilitoribacter sp. EG35]|uniref:cytochrome P450 n=1 Tax=Lentilitoribacter sp. EG35 TaxID=3234192 RepID=UPI003460467D